jgi:hypothetical protein
VKLEMKSTNSLNGQQIREGVTKRGHALVRPSGSRFQCTGCFHHFAGPQAYGMHFADDAQCMNAEEMRAAGMALNAAGFWTFEHSARSDDGTPAESGSAATAMRSQRLPPTLEKAT